MSEMELRYIELIKELLPEVHDEMKLHEIYIDLLVFVNCGKGKELNG